MSHDAAPRCARARWLRLGLAGHVSCGGTVVVLVGDEQRHGGFSATRGDALLYGPPRHPGGSAAPWLVLGRA